MNIPFEPSKTGAGSRILGELSLIKCCSRIYLELYLALTERTKPLSNFRGHAHKSLTFLTFPPVPLFPFHHFPDRLNMLGNLRPKNVLVVRPQLGDLTVPQIVRPRVVLQKSTAAAATSSTAPTPTPSARSVNTARVAPPRVKLSNAKRADVIDKYLKRNMHRNQWILKDEQCPHCGVVWLQGSIKIQALEDFRSKCKRGVKSCIGHYHFQLMTQGHKQISL